MNGEKVTNLVIPDGVTAIKNYAFPGCSGLTDVTIGNGVTSIGTSAFEGCTSLKMVTIGSGVKCILPSAFEGCSGLTSITIPNSVTSIDNEAFYGCTGLTEVTIGNGVTSIGEEAFYGCENLKTVINCSSLNIVVGSTENGYVAYYADRVAQDASIEGDFVFGVIDGVNTLIDFFGSSTRITLPDSYKGENYVIGERVFQKNTTITSVTIPASVTSIGEYAFLGCKGLASVTIPNSVTSISSYTFRNCTGLTSVVIPNSVTRIGRDAFYGCTGLTEVTIGNGVTSIGSSAFRGCKALKTVINCSSSLNITAGSTENGYVAYYADKVINAQDVSIEGDFAFVVKDGVNTLTEYFGSSTRITLPDSYKGENYVIDERVFQKNTTITSVTIPDGVTSIGSSAFEGCTGLTNVTIGNGVTSIGESAFNGCSGLTNVTIGNGVTRIGYTAFYGCKGLKSIRIPNSVTSIGRDAFNGCNIEKLEINCDNIRSWFCGITSIKMVVIGDEVTSIDEYAFLGCTGLTEVTIGNSVTSIGEYAFEGCTGLTNVTIGNGVTSIGRDAFLGCTGLTYVVIPNSVTSIGESAFYGCSGLKSIRIPNSVTSIGDWAFYGCTRLASVRIGSGASIGESAFEGCTGLIVVSIVDGVTSIGESAFEGCTGLTYVVIPNSVTSIGRYAFYGCTGLANIIVEDGNTVYDSRDNCNAIIETATNTLVQGCNNTIIPNSVTSIGDFAFYGCTGLTDVTIGNGVTSIGISAFNGCSGLTSIEIPNSVTSIGEYAFYGCENLKTVINFSSLNIVKGSYDNGRVAYYADRVVDVLNGLLFEVKDDVNTLIGYLGSSTEKTLPDAYKGENYVIGEGVFKDNTSITSVTIPAGVTNIANNAFRKCTGLTSVTIGSGVTSIGSSAFYGCSGLAEIYVESPIPATIKYYTFEGLYEQATLYVPAGAKAAYEAADYWKNFTIVEQTTTLLGDINSDNKVDVGDVTILIGMILDASLLTDAGDVNGDGTVDVADITDIISIILSTNNTPARAAAMEEYNVELSVEGDEQSLTIDATATDYPYSAVQFDVYLPAGVKAIGNMVVGCGNAAAYKEQADGAVRVVIYSPSNTAITNKSASIAIDATGLALGSHPVEVKNIILAAPGRAKAIAWDSTGYITIAGTTGIDGVVSDAGNADAVVYDLQGHRVTEIVKGRVYIKNGSKFIAQ